MFNGEFLCWIDIDDALANNAIEEKIEILKNNLKYDCVTSNAYVYDEKNLTKPISLLVSKYNILQYKKNQFKRTIYGKSIFCPGCHMVRMKKFLKECPDKSIYPSRAGQAWQLLLPIYYNANRKYINKPLYNYVVRKNSLSRSDDTKTKALKKIKEYGNILNITINSIKSMDEKDKKIYLLEVQKALKIRLLEVAYQYNDKELYEKSYKELRKLGSFKLLYFYRRIKINGRKCD